MENKLKELNVWIDIPYRIALNLKGYYQTIKYICLYCLCLAGWVTYYWLAQHLSIATLLIYQV